MSTKAIDKYLSYYAEVEAKQLPKLDHIYDYVLVIPIYNEKPDCLKRILQNIDESNILIIVVVNAPPKVDDELNHIFIEALLKYCDAKKKLNSDCQLLKFRDGNDVLLVDRNRIDHRIPKKQGVGLARKIGADIAVKCFIDESIRWPWIFSTDADVILPEQYFSFISDMSVEYSAVVLDFQHISDDDHLNELQFYYDFKMRYYLSGIDYAGIGYSYIPLGSTLIININSYAQVRGFPKKNAAEDFYLLNKINKVKPVKYLYDDIKVLINCRFSNRVPFGTGPALQSIDQLVSVNDYQYYNPECFVILKKWLSYLKSLWCGDCLQIIKPDDLQLLALYEFFDCQEVLNKCQSQVKSAEQWQQFVHQWFDAFKTLKAVHFFDKKLIKFNYSELIRTASFAKVSSIQLSRFMSIS